MKPGPAFASAFFTAPAGPAVGAIYFAVTSYFDTYLRTLANNAASRQAGYPAVDPTLAEFVWGSAVPVAAAILFFGLVFAAFGNFLVGVPVTLLAERVLGRWPLLATLVCCGIGAGLGAYLWSQMSGPYSPFDLWRASPGVVIGAVAALAMVLVARRIDRSWREEAA